MKPGITIIIPTYNRIRALQAVWRSYLTHPDVARIIVVDDGSTDGTSEQVRELGRNSPFRVDVIRNERQLGQPASRMTGIAAAGPMNRTAIPGCERSVCATVLDSSRSSCLPDNCVVAWVTASASPAPAAAVTCTPGSESGETRRSSVNATTPPA